MPAIPKLAPVLVSSSVEGGSFNLHPDILWEIFTFCSSMDLKSENYNPAVDTLRNISQVSSSWRNLALNSSPLWGCVLNLTRLERSKKWLDEVVKRSKKSWLYIKAVPKGEVRDIRYNSNFVRLFITKNWDRIWDLDLKPALEFGPIEEPREWCSLFSRSSNLRSLKVDSMIWVSDLFPVLCPHLELLELSDDSRSAVHIQRKDSLLLPGPPISLPGLKKIKIKSHWPYTVDGVMMALQRIAPAASCLLYLHCRVGRFPGEMNFVANSMPLVIPKYLCCAQETLASMESPFAHIVMTTSCVDFTFSSARLLPEKVDDGIFRFALDGADHAQFAQLIPKFISSFASLQIDEVKALSLTIHLARDQKTLASTAARQFVQTFPSIEHLLIDHGTIDSLDIFQTQADHIFFPNLNEISLHGCDSLSPHQIATLPLFLGRSPEARVNVYGID